MNNQTADKPPNIWLMGEFSTGKTQSIQSLIDAGIEVFLIATEPGAYEILGNNPPEKLHIAYIKSYGVDLTLGSPTNTLDQLKATAKLLQTHDMESIKKLPGQNRGQYNQFFELLSMVNNYVDQRTGQAYGDTGNFGPNQALVIDGLSGVNNMVRNLVGGSKPSLSWPEYDACQFTIEQFINTLAQALKCWFIVTSHVELEPDPMTGLKRTMPSTIGKALAPKITKFFSEVIVTKRVMDNGKSRYIWDNISTDATVKNRNIPQAPDHAPSFALIKSNWEKKIEFNQAT